jgi:hypothetical protein
MVIRNRKRIEEAESLLSPREIFCSWLEEVQQFDSPEEYIVSLGEDLTRFPLPRMLQLVRDGIRKTAHGRNKTSADLLRKRSSELKFHFYLFMEANSLLRNFLSERLNSAKLAAALENEMASTRGRYSCCGLIYVG